MHLKLIFCIAIMVLLFGCATQSRTNKTGAGIFTWKTDRSAAITYPAGAAGTKMPYARGCMQMALSMTDSNSKIEAALSDSILKIIDKLPKNPKSEDLAKITTEIQRTSKALNKSTERTTFLMVGYFYLCQLQANGLSEDKVVTLGTAIVEGAANLEHDESMVSTQK